MRAVLRSAPWTIALAIPFSIGACGARSGLRDAPERRLDAAPGPIDGGRDAPIDAGRDAPADAPPDAPFDAGCTPLPDGCTLADRCGDAEDGDCDGVVDEDCPCEPGEVQACFPGPPGRRGVGVCTDGAQVCELSGRWGPCTGGIGPQPDVCDGRDNLCDGCSARRDCPIDCPSPGDPRVPLGAPFEDYPLRGRDFYRAPARSWRWTVQGGPCDRLAPRLVSFELESPTSETATFVPQLSGDYTVTLEVVTMEGTRLGCSWIVRVVGPGLRIEMCYPESETQDLDLFLHQPRSTAPWYREVDGDGVVTATDAVPETCGWHDCEAMIRGSVGRVDWGYPRSPLAECENGPQGEQWRALGFCTNPRLDLDNNLSEGIGVPENINLDVPREGETFRVMVQNWTGTRARPVVNVYCSGERVATYGAAPDEVPAFEGAAGSSGVGAMWRVVDVTTHVGAGGTVSCDLAPLHPPGMSRGYWVTRDDPRF
jgi:hypothetical protein